MKCTDFELRLQTLFDERGQLDGDAELQAHVLTCRECETLVETYQLLFDGLSARISLGDTRPACSKMAAIAPPKRQRAASSHGAIARWAAAAAVLAAVTLSAPAINVDPLDVPRELVVAPIADLPAVPTAVATTPTTQTILAPSTAAPAVVAAMPVAIPHVESEPESTGLGFLESPADEYANLYRATGRSLAAMVRSIPSLSAEVSANADLDDATTSSRWRMQIPSSIEPLTASVAEALQELFRGKPAASPPQAAGQAS